MNKMKEYAAMRKAELKERIEKECSHPLLLIIRVGENPASERYVRNKIKDCEEVGIFAVDAHLPEGISTIGLMEYIQYPYIISSYKEVSGEFKNTLIEEFNNNLNVLK